MKKISALALALLLALQLSAGAASLQVATTGTVSGLANNQQINVIAGNLATMIESASAPTTTSTGLSSTAGVWWHDTGNKIIFVRDQADANWLPVFYLDETGHLIGTSGQAGAWVTVGGTGNAVTLTYPVAPAAYPQGMKLAFKATAANTGPMTVNANSLGNKNVFKKSASGPVALTGAEIQIGDLVELESDGTQLQIISSLPTTPFAGGTLTSTTTMSGASLNTAAAVDIASATTMNIMNAASNFVRITGTSGISSLGVNDGAWRFVTFLGAVTVRNNASIFLPGGADRIAAAGDTAMFIGEG
ncbi:MAG: hypothetical protein JWL84_596, partial [Rhodospirillales bacterium]|nr:hypothetical protein [Rhodospirillales bacterium]